MLALIEKDNRSVPARSIRNLRELAAQPDLVAALAGCYSPVVVEALPIVHELGLPLLVPWAAADPITAHDLTPSYVFRLSLKDTWALQALLTHAERQGMTRVGLLLSNTERGRSSQRAAEAFAQTRPALRIAVDSVMAIVGVCLIFGSISFTASLWMVHAHERQTQQEALARIGTHLDDHVATLVRQTQILAQNPLVFSALLDSEGRDIYLQPFFANYRLSIPETHGLALCDFEGQPLAQQDAYPVSCFAGSAETMAVTDLERPQTRLTFIADEPHAIFFQPVLYPGTQRAEGYLVAALALRTMLLDEALVLPAGVLFLRSADGAILHAVADDHSVSALPARGDPARPLFATSPFADLGLSILLHQSSALPAGSRYLLAGYGVATLGLIALAWLVSRKTAHALAAPLIELNMSARRIAALGPEAGPVTSRRADEIGQLAIAFNEMVAALRAKQEQLAYLAYHDGLTGLPNRVLLHDRMEQAIARASRGRGQIAICYLDLDGFKPVNDQYGHKSGDQVLVEVAHRLAASLRTHDTVARLGGDEFVLLLTDISSANECERIATRVIRALTVPYPLGNGISASISASIGILIYPNDETPATADPDQLLRHADQAMYLAKRAGRSRVVFFNALEQAELDV